MFHSFSVASLISKLSQKLMLVTIDVSNIEKMMHESFIQLIPYSQLK